MHVHFWQRPETEPTLELERLLSEQERALIAFFAFEDQTRPGTVGVPAEGEGREWQRERMHAPRALTAVVSPRRTVAQRPSGPQVQRDSWQPIGCDAAWQTEEEQVGGRIFQNVAFFQVLSRQILKES